MDSEIGYEIISFKAMDRNPVNCCIILLNCTYGEKLLKNMRFKPWPIIIVPPWKWSGKYLLVPTVFHTREAALCFSFLLSYVFVVNACQSETTVREREGDCFITESKNYHQSPNSIKHLPLQASWFHVLPGTSQLFRQIFSWSHAGEGRS